MSLTTFFVQDGSPMALIHDSKGKPHLYHVRAEHPAGSDLILRFTRPDREKEYTVCIDGRDTLCNCEAFRFGCGGEHGCKHARAALDLARIIKAVASGLCPAAVPFAREELPA